MMDECERAKRRLGPSGYVSSNPWAEAVNNGATTLIILYDSAGKKIAEVRCLNGHKMEILDAWENRGGE